MAYPFIVFEGVDGSGKTTIAKALAERIGAHYYYNPPAVLRPFRTYADASSPKIRFRYCSLGNRIASLHIRWLLRTRPVVCDWYVFSTIAYHSVLLGVKLPMPGRTLMPDRIVRTRADWDEISRRLTERGKVSKYEELEFLKQVSPEYDRIFSGMENLIELDSSGKTVAESVDELVLRFGR